MTITAEDQSGNLVPGYSGAVTITSSDKQTIFISDPSINLINGTATIMVTLGTPNTVSLTAVSSKLSGTSSPTAVSPTVTSFAITAPATAVAGTGFPVTITAKDRHGNTVNFSGPVTLTSSDGQPIAGSPATITMSQGSAQVSAILDKADKVTLTAGAGSVQGTSSSITVSPAAATKFTVSTPSTAAQVPRSPFADRH